MATEQKNILIVYHTQTGNTGQLASAASRGARAEPGCAVQCIMAAEATLDHLLWCHGLLLGTPENFGYMSGMLKDFFDRTYYPAEPYQLNKPYALFISAGNDGTGAAREVARIAKGYPLVPVADPLICRGEITPQYLQDAQALGQAMAAGLALGIF